MKRLLCLFLLSCFFLSACSSTGERVKEPVTFYYIRQNYQEDMGAVIAGEIREASGHRYDLPYLLALYSMGPSGKDLIPPFPQNTTILPVEHSEEGLVLSILNEIQDMTEAEYTLASTCLAMTCMELVDVDQVTVVCNNRSVAINRGNILITGDMIQKLPEGAK